MTTARVWPLLICSGALWAQQPTVSSIELQRRSIENMQRGLQAQQESVRRQAPARPSRSNETLAAPVVSMVTSTWQPPACEPVPAERLDSLISDSSEREGVDKT